MSPLVKVLLFLLCAAEVLGVKLPGTCPQVPATHEFPRYRPFQELILIVPFTDPNTTNLFKYIDARNKKEYGFKILTEMGRLFAEIIEIDIKNTLLYDRYWLTNTVEYLNESDSFNIKSRISIENKNSIRFNCHDIYEVNVRLWFDGEFAFIWSCRENSNLDHEEAVAVVAMHDNSSILSNHRPLKEYFKMIKRLNITMRRFIRGPLLNVIEEHLWILESGIGKHSDEIIISCENDTHATDPWADLDIIIFSVFLSATILIVGVLIWKATKED